MIRNKFSISMTTDNDAFAASETDRILEVARILRDLADRLESDAISIGGLWDINGNLVGQYEFYTERERADISTNT